MAKRASIPKTPAPPHKNLAAFVGDDGKSINPDPAAWEPILQSYSENLCSLTRTAKAMKIPYGTLRRWVKEPAFADALSIVKEIQDEEILHAYTVRALDPLERNVAYKIFYLKKNISRYDDKPRSVPPQKIEVTLTDTTFDKRSDGKPESERAVESPPDPAKVP